MAAVQKTHFGFTDGQFSQAFKTKFEKFSKTDISRGRALFCQQLANQSVAEKVKASFAKLESQIGRVGSDVANLKMEYMKLGAATEEGIDFNFVKMQLETGGYGYAPPLQVCLAAKVSSCIRRASFDWGVRGAADFDAMTYFLYHKYLQGTKGDFSQGQPSIDETIDRDNLLTFLAKAKTGQIKTPEEIAQRKQEREAKAKAAAAPAPATPSPEPAKVNQPVVEKQYTRDELLADLRLNPALHIDVHCDLLELEFNDGTTIPVFKHTKLFEMAKRPLPKQLDELIKLYRDLKLDPSKNIIQLCNDLEWDYSFNDGRKPELLHAKLFEIAKRPLPKQLQALFDQNNTPAGSVQTVITPPTVVVSKVADPVIAAATAASGASPTPAVLPTGQGANAPAQPSLLKRFFSSLSSGFSRLIARITALFKKCC